eukprot:7657216-Ditylum_brightwellii.AAC.1
MESGCDGRKGTFGVNTFPVLLLGVCTKLVVDEKDIIGGCGGGKCAGKYMGGPVKVVNRLYA